MPEEDGRLPPGELVRDLCVCWGRALVGLWVCTRIEVLRVMERGKCVETDQEPLRLAVELDLDCVFIKRSLEAERERVLERPCRRGRSLDIDTCTTMSDGVKRCQHTHKRVYLSEGRVVVLEGLHKESSARPCKSR